MDCLACHTENVDTARFCAKCGAPLPVRKTEDADPLIGQTIGGRYRITGILGEGGMGRVYAAEQKMGTSVRKAAIKTLLSQYAKDPQTVARFMREVGTVSELEHPNTIKVYDAGQIEGTGELYIAMELLQGVALDDLLASGQPLPPERVDRIVGQVCGSLQEAHDKGIVHRDLKPANIYLTTRAGEPDVVKVLDFGIAKRGGSRESKTEQKLTQQGTILGTPPYMSPEQFTGKELDARSDLYSLGILAYEMLTGRLPFEADTPWQWMTQHMNAQPFPFETIPAAANVPPKMRQAVMRALSKEPSQRPQSARELFEDLTLGATRMSALGLGAAGVDGIRSMPGGVSYPNISTPQRSSDGGANRPGSTQIGEPLIPDAAPYPMGAGLTAPGLDPYVAVGHPAVPTAGGHAFPAPPQKPAKSGSGGVVAAILALCVLGGATGAFFYWRSQQSPTSASGETAETEDADDDTTATATSTSVASAPPSAPPTNTVATEQPTAPSSTPPSTTVATLPGHSPLPTEQEWTTSASAGGASDTTVLNATKLGCEAKTLREWVRVRCNGKNDSGGTPVAVSLDKGGDKGDTFTELKDGATTLVYPFQDDRDLEATFRWTDKAAKFKSVWPKGMPRPPAVGAFDPPAPQPIALQPKPEPLPIPRPEVVTTRPTEIEKPERPEIKRPERPEIKRPERPEVIKRPEVKKPERTRPRPGEIRIPRH
ncbi:MAG: protein kinase [Polyangiaceae bacterium]|nr:protein kinase [Polyangiaceae bacterium]